jgi:pyruvate formate lyase activating enzyme
MKIGGFQKFSLIDYPAKFSAIIFTQGCNFRCGFCHNPELVDPKLFTKNIPEQEILDFLKKRRDQLDAVVVTGGEPLLQINLEKFLKKLKKLGYSIKLDTNGSFPKRLEKIIKEKLVDYIAMDIKAPIENQNSKVKSQKYSEITGTNVDTKKILKSINLIMGSGIDYEFRTTIVKSQLTENDILKIGEMIKGAKLYALQKFIPTKTLDPKFLKETTYSDKELERIKEKMLGLFKINCIIR